MRQTDKGWLKLARAVIPDPTGGAQRRFPSESWMSCTEPSTLCCNKKVSMLRTAFCHFCPSVSELSWFCTDMHQGAASACVVGWKSMVAKTCGSDRRAAGLAAVIAHCRTTAFTSPARLARRCFSLWCCCPEHAIVNTAYLVFEFWRLTSQVTIHAAPNPKP